MVETIETDLCVIGAGSGGLSVAAGAVQMGAKVVLIEGHKMGGDCLNYGCVPSKALIAASKHAHAFKTGRPFGVAPVEPEVDFSAAMAHVQSVIAGIEPHDSVERFESLGVQVIQEMGKFVSRDEVMAGDYRIKARRFVVATGSAPFVPNILGLDDIHYLTNETLFDLKEQPKHLIIVGGGPIGMEMAQAFCRLGSKVTVIEAEKALGREDPEVAELVLNRLRTEGVEIIEKNVVGQVLKTDEGVSIPLSEEVSVDGSHLLIAIGRKPNTENLSLEAAGVDVIGSHIAVDDRLRTSNKRIFAIGDVSSKKQFTHVAGYQAGVVIRSALFGLPAKAGDSHIPWATYTDPEIASIGYNEFAAKAAWGEKGFELLRFDYAENDRARAELKTEGFVKVVVRKGRPVGATIVGAQAGELIQVWALAIANKMKIGAVAGMVTPYPTLGEINKRAAGQYYIPRLFENDTVKRVVRFVQRYL